MTFIGILFFEGIGGGHNDKDGANSGTPLYYSGDTAHYHAVPSFYGGRPQFMGGGLVRTDL